MVGVVAMTAALALPKAARNLTNCGIARQAFLNLAAFGKERFDLRVYVLSLHLGYSGNAPADWGGVVRRKYRRINGIPSSHLLAEKSLYMGG